LELGCERQTTAASTTNLYQKASPTTAAPTALVTAAPVAGAQAPTTTTKDTVVPGAVWRDVTPYNLKQKIPSAAKIQQIAKAENCVTMKDPLAVSTQAGVTISPEGTPCQFLAGEMGEGKHCLEVESGRYGAYGWCWTDMNKKQWGSCNKHCPLSGMTFLPLEKKLNGLESLIEDLDKKVSSKAAEEAASDAEKAAKKAKVAAQKAEEAAKKAKQAAR